MVRNIIPKNLLTHLAVAGLFLVITLVYFYPVLEGKRLMSHDNVVYRSSAQEIFEHREEHKEEPLWTNAMFGGMPAYLISTLYPGNLISHIDSFLKAFKVPVAAIFLTMLGFYVLLLLFGVNPWIAAAGAIAYSFSSYLFIILGAGHNTKAYALAYMAPIIGSILYAYRKNIWQGALMLAWFLTLQIMANHLQITYYTLIALVVFGITELIYSIRGKTLLPLLKKTVILFIPVIIAVAVNFGTIISTWEYGKYSMRGESELIKPAGERDSGLTLRYATQWSYGIDETLTLLIPNFKGGASRPLGNDSETFRVLRQNQQQNLISHFPRYWGTQPGTDGPVYVGALIVFLFVLGLFILKGRDKWWLLIATILSIMLSWGKNFMPMTEFFMNVVPGYDKFRAVSMTLVIAEFTIAFTALLALHAVVSGKIAVKAIIDGLKKSVAVVGGLLLLILLIPGLAGSFLSSFEQEQALPSWLTTALIADRKELLRSDALRSLLFVISGAGLLYFYIIKKVSFKLLVTGLILIILVDMWPINKRYLNSDKFVLPSQFNRAFTPTPADQFILDDKEESRVLNLTVSTFNDASTSVHHHSVGGYHGAKMMRYQELIDSVMVREIQLVMSALQQAESIGDAMSVFTNTHALNMLNTRYIIYNPQAEPIVNPFSMGNAWFVDTVHFVSDSNEELRRLPSIDIRREALVKDAFRTAEVENSDNPGSEDDYIDLVSYRANELTYKAVSSANRLAVFSEIHYPAGWEAYLNGEKVAYIRANYLLRALPVPPGEHEIKFVFAPSSYKTGNRVALAGSLVLLLVTAGAVAMAVAKRRGQDDE
jgi:hypothetical protein